MGWLVPMGILTMIALSFLSAGREFQKMRRVQQHPRPAPRPQHPATAARPQLDKTVTFVIPGRQAWDSRDLSDHGGRFN